MFAKKLSILMECLDISNVQLAAEIHLDPSYISKLRNGKRKLPSHPDFLENANAFFVEEAKRKNREDVLAQIIQEPWPSHDEEAVMLLNNWLSDQLEQGDLISKLLYQFSNTDLPGDVERVSVRDLLEEPEMDFYYGREGKRQAVVRFFEDVLSAEEPPLLKLHSEENMLWLFEDKGFAQRWGALFAECLKRGSRVKIIHNLSRDLDELIESLIRWIPVYMTGQILPYYCPRKRDGIFQRTLFIAQDTAAVTSTALAHDPEDMLNVYIDDADAVHALEREFDRYLDICRPLMNIINDDFINEYPKLYSEIIMGDGDVYYKGANPSLITLPDSLARDIDKRCPGVGFYELYRDVRSKFLEKLKTYEVHTIINIPVIEETVLQQSVFFADEPLVLSREEKKQHYAEVLRLAKEYDNYKIYFDKDIDLKLSLFLRTEQGIIVERHSFPRTLFGIREATMTSAFYYYLDDACRFARVKDKDKAVEHLEYILK